MFLVENKNKCVLYCRVENRKDYYKFAEKVKDGTKCDLNQYDICVNGICKKGGCDHALGSDLILGKVFKYFPILSFYFYRNISSAKFFL